MGGRGTFSKGNIPEVLSYESLGDILGIHVIKGTPQSNEHNLPFESNTSKMYLRINPYSGEFHTLRIYNDKHQVITEYSYHVDGKNNNGNKWFHVHTYEYDKEGNVTNRTKRGLTKDEMAVFRSFRKHVKKKGFIMTKDERKEKTKLRRKNARNKKGRSNK